MIARILSAAAAAILLTATAAAGQSAFNTNNAPDTPIKTDTGPVSEDDIRALVRDTLLVGVAGLYHELAYGFPEDYLEFETKLVETLKGEEVPDDVFANLAYDFYAGLKGDYETGLASAPTRLMVQRLEQEGLMLTALADKPAACVELINDNILQPATLEGLSEAQQAQYVAYSNARARALRAGLETPLQHAETSDEEMAAAMAAYKKLGGKTKLIDTYYENYDKLSETELCLVITDFTRAVLTLPNDSIARFMAAYNK